MRTSSLLLTLALFGCDGDSATTEDLGALQASLDALTGRTESLETELQATKAALAATEAALEVAEADYTALQTDVTDLYTDLAALSGGVTFTDITDDVATQTARIDAIEGAYASLADVDAADAALAGRVSALEGAGYATEAWVTSQAYAADADVMGLDTRVSTLEAAGLATEAWVDSLGFATTADLGTTDGELAALDGRLTGLEDADLDTRVTAVEDADADGRVTTLEDANLDTRLTTLEDATPASADDVDALDGRLTAVEDAGYATEAWVSAAYAPLTATDALHGRVSSLEGAGYATEAWVSSQAYASASALQGAETELANLDGRLDNLEGTDLATETWVSSQGFATATDLGATEGDLSALDGRVTTLEGTDLATETWVGAQGFAAAADLGTAEEAAAALDGRVSTLEGAGYLTSGDLPAPWDVGDGLLLSGNTLSVDVGLGLDLIEGLLVVDQAEVEGIATDVCYNTEAELLAVLSDNFLGTGAGDVRLPGALQVGDTDATCTTADVGMIRYVAGAFEGCTSEGWVSIGLVQDGSTPNAAALSCDQLHTNYPLLADGTYWLTGSAAVPYQTWCDMTSDGGGWTLVGTIAGGDAQGWNQQFGNWSSSATLGTAAQPWLDFKSRAWFDMDVSDSEVLFQRRYGGVVKGQATLSNSCLHGVQYFVELFETWDTSLRCGISEVTVILAPTDSAGLSGSNYKEGETDAIGGSGTNGFCWNGGDTLNNTFKGHAGWNQDGYGCLDEGHLGYVGVWENGDNQFSNSDITGTNWLQGSTYSLTEISLFVR